MSEPTISANPHYQSLMVELLRTGAAEMIIGTGNAIMSRGVPYVVQVQDRPARDVKCPLDYLDLLGCIERLDYNAPDGGFAAVKTLSDEVTSFVGQVVALGEPRPLQIDLVVSASELAALPFELARDKTGEWLLAREDADIELTRRIRQSFAHRAPRWRTKPRILFISASPGAGEPVPVEENKKALRDALRPWIEPLANVPEAMPDERDVLVLLPNASLAAIKEACDKAAAAKKPFTHIHVLAHGVVIGEGVRQRYGLALHGEDVEAAGLLAALKSVAEYCSVVTLAICQGAAENNPIYPGSSLAHGLHAEGIPVVIGSQFPLTFDGSKIFTERFYTAALRGDDVRAALHAARLALKKQSAKTYYDWAALVGYVRLPEGYTDHLIDVALEAGLASLRTTESWFAHISAQDPPPVDPLHEVARRIDERIGHLGQLLSRAEQCGRTGVREENLGLLGSGEKRLAEVRFKLSQTEPAVAAHKTAMLQALERSLDYYRRAFHKNLSHHWTGVQMLSLEAATAGRFDEPEYWSTAIIASRNALKDNKDEYWAAGSLLELLLLGGCSGKSVDVAAAKRCAETLAERTPVGPADGTEIPFPIASTLRQLGRYQSWWTKANGFFNGAASDLAREAGELSKALEDAWKARRDREAKPEG
jgi:CHAT domain-containing protein